MSYIALFLCLMGIVSALYADTYSDLQNQIKAMVSAVDVDVAQDIEVINAISVAIALPLSATVATVQGTAGAVVNLPVYLKTGSKDVSSMQFDLALPSGFSASSVTPGIAAQAANKGVQGSQVTGGYRVLIFGINQTAIPSGPVAVVKVVVDPSQAPCKCDVSLNNVVASDQIGMNVPLTAKSGSITVE